MTASSQNDNEERTVTGIVNKVGRALIVRVSARGTLPRIVVLLAAICVHLSAQTLRIATIQGVLLKSDGKPLSYTEIELVPVGHNKIIVDQRLNATSSVSGKFTFSDVPPGRYTLSLNFDDRPSNLSPYDSFFYKYAFDRVDAEVLDITSSTRIRDLVFRLPPALVQRKLSGFALWEDGSPVKGACLAMWDMRVDIPVAGFDCSNVTDASGRFTVIGFEHRKYRVGAFAFEGIWKKLGDPLPKFLGAGESETFALDDSTRGLEIRLRRSRDAQGLLDRYIGMR